MASLLLSTLLKLLSGCPKILFKRSRVSPFSPILLGLSFAGLILWWIWILWLSSSEPTSTLWSIWILCWLLDVSMWLISWVMFMFFWFKLSGLSAKMLLLLIRIGFGVILGWFPSPASPLRWTVKGESLLGLSIGWDCNPPIKPPVSKLPNNPLRKSPKWDGCSFFLTVTGFSKAARWSSSFGSAIFLNNKKPLGSSLWPSSCPLSLLLVETLRPLLTKGGLIALISSEVGTLISSSKQPSSSPLSCKWLNSLSNLSSPTLLRLENSLFNGSLVLCCMVSRLCSLENSWLIFLTVKVSSSFPVPCLSVLYWWENSEYEFFKESSLNGVLNWSTPIVCFFWEFWSISDFFSTLKNWSLWMFWDLVFTW